MHAYMHYYTNRKKTGLHQNSTENETIYRRCHSIVNKSSAVAEMGDRLATVDMGRKVGAVVPISLGS